MKITYHRLQTIIPIRDEIYKTIIFNTWKVSKTIINCILISNGIQAQGLLNKSESNFTRQDSLRGVLQKKEFGGM
jgi:hypothetical protein